MGERSDRIQVI